MTFTANNLTYTIDMEAREIYVSGGMLSGRNVTESFDRYNAEDCETAEEVKEMILEYLEETAA